MPKDSDVEVDVGPINTITIDDSRREPAQAPASTASALSKAHNFISIFVLFVVFFLGQYDKFILSYFKTPITEELNISSVQYGILSGYATGISYAILSIPVAYVSDSASSRIWTLTVAVIWWSLCVTFQGLSQTYWELVCARVGMGIGQSAAEALSVSLISDLMDSRQYVSTGESILYIGIYIGEAISGQISTAFRITGTSWRWALKGVGIFGIGAGIVLRVIMWREIPCREAVIADDRRELDLAQAKEKLRLTVAHLFTLRSFALFAISAGLRTLAGSVFGYYMPAYLQGLYPDIENLMSIYGIIVGVVGSIASLTGGAVTSWLWKRTKITPLYVVSIGGCLSSIFVWMMIFSRGLASGSETQGTHILYGTMAAAYITAEMWLGPVNGLLILMMRTRVKTFAFSIYSSVVTLIASSGPEIVGLALRRVDKDSTHYEDSVRVVLAVIIPGGYILSSIGFLACIPLTKKDLLVHRESTPDITKAKILVLRNVQLGSGIAILVVVIILFTMSLTYQA